MLQGLENNLKLQTIEIANNKIAKLDGENNIHINLATAPIRALVKYKKYYIRYRSSVHFLYIAPAYKTRFPEGGYPADIRISGGYP